MYVVHVVHVVHHSFIPVSAHEHQMRQISQDVKFTLVNIRLQEDSAHKDSSYQQGKYVACVYDYKWYVGCITAHFDENQDVEVEFMNRKDRTVSWPVDTRRDRSWIPLMCNHVNQSSNTTRTDWKNVQDSGS